MRSLALACVVLAAVVGCGGAAPAPKAPGQGSGAPADREYLANIAIEGNKSISTDELLPGLDLQRVLDQRESQQAERSGRGGGGGGRGVDAYQLSIDMERIRAAYLKLGFFDVLVDHRVTTPAAGPLKGKAQTVTFTVVEGPRSTMRVEILGLPEGVALEDARALIPVADGAPFDYEAYDDAKDPMVRLLEDAGYANVQIEAAVLASKKDRVATARFEITSGPRAYFGEITIDGTTSEDLVDAIRGRLSFEKGDVYSATALRDSQTSIYELGRFTTVKIDPDRTGTTEIEVKISVTTGTRHELRMGFGVGLDKAAAEGRLRFGYGVIPELAPLLSFGFDARPGVSFLYEDIYDPDLKLRLIASLYREDLFRPRLRGELELAIDIITVEAYSTTGPRVRAGLSSPLGVPWLTGRVGLLFEYLDFNTIIVIEEERAALGLVDQQRRGAVEALLLADRRDNKFEARKGWYAAINATQGTPYLGGETTYTQLVPELRLYYPFPGFVAAVRGRFGYFWGDVPVTERFFSGGVNHRGFPARRLSPTVQTIDLRDKVVIGGVAMIESGLEARIPIFDGSLPLGINVFLDAGDVVADAAELDVGNLHYATGAGIYVKFLGLKARFEVGYRLNRTSERSDGIWENLAWHFGVGDSF